MIPLTVACQAPLSMGFPKQEYWSGLPFPSPGDLPDPGNEPTSPESLALQVDSFFFFSINKFIMEIIVKYLNLSYKFYH